MERKTAKALSNGLMGQLMLGNLQIIILMAMVSMSGLMAEGMREDGKIIKWMEKEYSLGRMVENILESMLMIKKKDMVSLHGQKAKFIKATGKTVNNMVMERIKAQIKKKDTVNGLMAKR